jgi:hypothetical protein
MQYKEFGTKLSPFCENAEFSKYKTNFKLSVMAILVVAYII